MKLDLAPTMNNQSPLQSPVLSVRSPVISEKTSKFESAVGDKEAAPSSAVPSSRDELAVKSSQGGDPVLSQSNGQKTTMTVKSSQQPPALNLDMVVHTLDQMPDKESVESPFGKTKNQALNSDGDEQPPMSSRRKQRMMLTNQQQAVQKSVRELVTSSVTQQIFQSVSASYNQSINRFITLFKFQSSHLNPSI